MNTNDEILDLPIKRDLLLQRVGNGLSKDIALKYIKMNIETVFNELIDYIFENYNEYMTTLQEWLESYEYINKEI